MRSQQREEEAAAGVLATRGGGAGQLAGEAGRRGQNGGALFLWTKEEEGDPRGGFAISKISRTKLKSKLSH